MSESARKRYLSRYGALVDDRSSWLAHWRECADYILPRRFRELVASTNDGSKRNDKIINNTATRAARTLASGLHAGITSPARPWFRLTTPDPDLAEVGSVRGYLHAVEQRLLQVFARSNFYNSASVLYGDLGVFGTAAAFIEEDDRDVVRFYNLPIGQFVLALSHRNQVNTLMREIGLTVAQVVERFGLKKCSLQVRRLKEQGKLDQRVTVIHAVEPRADSDRQYGKADSKNMAFKSCWFEKDAGDDAGFLRESGFEEFPVVAPRWEVTGEDTYGNGPGMVGLGDTRALQLLEKRKLQAADKLVNPPMAGPASMRGTRVSLIPGEMNYVDAVSGGTVFRPAMEIPPVGIQVIGAEIMRHEDRINSAFFADLFLSMIQSEGQMTAREVQERHEEKMLQLGPVLERLHGEFLKPVIDRTYSVMARRDLLPPPPEELQGMDLKVEFISIMAQAQKLIGTSAIERLAAFAGNLVAVDPQAIHKINTDEMIDSYADALGTNPDLVRSDDEVAQMREALAQQAQAQQQAETMATAAQGAATLSKADLESDNALSRLLGGIGAPVPQGVQ